MNSEKEIRDLEEMIFAKRQQVDFEKNSIQNQAISSPENQVNPDVSEEFKNFNDPEQQVIDKGELKELSDAEAELIHLIDKLNKLRKTADL